MSTVIEVDRLSKQYRLGQIGGKRLVDDVSRWWAGVRGKDDPLSKIGVVSPADAETLWALKDVSFDVKQGEVLGIIGRNGAGKSTLLKILSRVTAPTTGEVRVKGRIASLLEVGTGFHPELTGRENIFLNGAILGMTKAETSKKFDEIVAFSEIDRFIDTPVKRYSSGMYVRLAFAVAAHLDPEILIVDEVLAVGDAQFQKKCLGKIQDVADRQGRTVLFVSHNMGAILNLCPRALLLRDGRVLRDGRAASTIQEYLESTADLLSMRWQRPVDAQEASLELRSATVELQGDQPDHKLLLELKCTSSARHKPGLIVFDVLDPNEAAIMQIIPSEIPFMEFDNGSHVLRIEAMLPPLIPGRYRITAWIGSDHGSRLDDVAAFMAFDVVAFPDPARTFPYYRSHGSIIATSSLAYEPAQPKHRA